MFKKLHLSLTLLCTGVTSLILLVMSLTYLHISEDVLRKSDFLSFQSNMNTLTATLEQQSVISHELLFKLESNNQYYIYPLDNGQPLLFNQLSDSTLRDSLFMESSQYFENHIYKDLEPSLSLPSKNSLHSEFIYSSASAGTDCHVCVIYIRKETGTLQLFVISPMFSLDERIKTQEIRFFIIVLSALLFLFLFAWIFTGTLLKPVEKNQRQQIQFISDASHELRTPLSVILSCASACTMASPQETAWFLSTIQSEGNRMSALLEDLLMLGKADSHTISYHMEPVEPDTLLLASYEAFEAMAREKEIKLSVSLPEIPAALCRLDKARIRQVLAILIHNAVNYTPVKGCIRLSLKQTASMLSFTVSDNGIGIPDSEKDFVFKRFYRAEKARNTKGHFGLGLSIAYEIIQAHKGTIQITDTPGGGSTFTVEIPVGQ